MKKKYIFILITIIIGLFLFLSFQNSRNNYNKSTFVNVINKEFKDNNYIVNVVETHNNDISYKIKIKDENLWNLIVSNKNYFIVYEVNSKNENILSQIEYLE